jgi:membrane protein
VTLLLGASGVFGQLQEAMNTIWKVPPEPKGGILETIKDRFFSFTMVLGVGFLLLVSLVVSAGLASLDEFVNNLLPSFVIVAQIINLVVSMLIVTGLFAVVFKVVPDVAVSWHDVWIGAFVTAVLFTIGKWGISLYLAKSAPASSYGAAGSLIVILLWIYYSAQILFLGAEFTQVYANRFGSKIGADWAVEAAEVEAGANQPGQLSGGTVGPTPVRQVGVPDAVKPAARLVEGFHHLLVSVLAIPAAVLRSDRENSD